MIADLKDALRDVPGIDSLTMTTLCGKQQFGWNGLLVQVGPMAPQEEIERSIRNTAQLANYRKLPANTIDGVPERKARMSISTGFAASLKALMDEARADLERTRTEGMTRVQGALGKYSEAKAATVQVSASLAKTIEDEAASVMAELGQISNDLTGASNG